jgi:hypothetical protein
MGDCVGCGTWDVEGGEKIVGGGMLKVESKDCGEKSVGRGMLNVESKDCGEKIVGSGMLKEEGGLKVWEEGC